MNRDWLNPNEECSLLDIWTRSQAELKKSQREFHGRSAYPNQIAQLYTHLKLDELLPTGKLTGYDIYIVIFISIILQENLFS